VLRFQPFPLPPVFLLPLALVGIQAPDAGAQERPLALVGARILPIASEPIDDGVLVVQDGRVVAVGPRGSTSIPDQAEVREVDGLWIMPGLVDTHSHLGRSDGGDRSFPLQPEARILDGLDARDPGIRKAMAGGLTTINVMPGSGHLISGQTAYIKLRGAATVEGLLFCEDPLRDICGGLKMANGTNPMGAPPFPGTRGRAAALVREEFRKAVDYRERVRSGEQEPSRATSRDLRMELLGEVLDGRRIVHMHSHRHDDILSALRLQEEFGYRLVLHHLSDGYLVADEIAANGAAASILAPDAPGGKEEALNATFAGGVALEEAGVPLAFHTDDGITDSRFFRRLAGMYVRAGVSREGALEALTLAGARMLGLEERVGSLEPGKDADFILLDGDPLSVYTHVQETWVEGQKVFDLSDPADRAFAVGGPGATRSPGGASLQEGGR
jgi:imidazolonepropionase-like amidohydrolase